MNDRPTDTAERQLAKLEEARAVAHALLKAGNPAGALEEYRSALLASVEPGRGLSALTAAQLVVIEEAADLALLLGEWAGAESLLRAIETTCRDADNVEGADYALLKRAHSQTMRGNLDAAMATLDDLAPRTGSLADLDFAMPALARWERKTAWQGIGRAARELLLTRLYLVLGTILVELGQYGAAVVATQRGLEIAVEAEPGSASRSAEIAIRLCLARAQLEIGQLSKAVMEVEGLQSRIDSREAPAMHAARLSLAARLAHIGGALGDALDHLAAVCQFCIDAHFPRAEIIARLNRAEIQVSLNQTRAAEGELDTAAHVAESLGDERLIQRIIWLRRAAEARREGAEDALVLAPSVRAMQAGMKRRRSESDSPPSVRRANVVPAVAESDGFWSRFEHRAEETIALIRSGEVAEAAAMVPSLELAFGSTDSSFLQGRLHHLKGLIAEASSDWETARRHYLEAEQVFDEIGAATELWRSQRTLTRLAVASRASEDELAACATRADETLRRIADSLPAQARAIYLLDKSDAEEDALRVDVVAIVDDLAAAEALPFLRRRKERRIARTMLLELLSRLDSRRTGRASTATGARLANLPPRSTTLAFLVLPDFLLVAALSRAGVACRLAPVSRLGLRDSLAQWHIGAQYEGVGADLGERVLRRLVELIDLDSLIEEVGRGCRRLRVVADDVLHGAPFAAFPCGESFLIERFSVCMVNSVFPARKRPAPKRRNDSGLAVGVSQSGGDFEALPNVPAEIAWVAEWMKQVHYGGRVLLDEPAALDAVIEQLPRNSFAHFACHGTFDPEQVDSSGLVLEPDRTPPKLLTLRAISRLDLSATRHVTLSACWGADNYVLPGRRVLSLPDAFVGAGTGSVLGSLWRVSDVVALHFIRRFYALAEHRRRVDALRAVQLECMRGELTSEAKIDSTSPYIWAGFTLHGDANTAPLLPWPHWMWRRVRYLINAAAHRIHLDKHVRERK